MVETIAPKEVVEVTAPQVSSPASIIDLVPAAPSAPTITMADLTNEERQELRAARFSQGVLSSDDALAMIEAEKRIHKERAERFGIVTPDVVQDMLKARQERFGMETKETLDVKRIERMKRFGVPTKEGGKGGQPEEPVTPE